MQALYDKGIFTGWALVVEMIERNQHASLEELAAQLRGMYQGKINERDQLVLDHASSMHKTLHLPKNAFKGHWSGTDIHILWDKLCEERREFDAALWGRLCHDQPIENLISEGADESNVVAMIVDNCKNLS